MAEIAKLEILLLLAREDHDYVMCKVLREKLAKLGVTPL